MSAGSWNFILCTLYKIWWGWKMKVYLSHSVLLSVVSCVALSLFKIRRIFKRNTKPVFEKSTWNWKYGEVEVWKMKIYPSHFVLLSVVSCVALSFFKIRRLFKRNTKACFFFRNPLEIKNLMRLEVENISLTLRPVFGCQLCCFAPCVSSQTFWQVTSICFPRKAFKNVSFLGPREL